MAVKLLHFADLHLGAPFRWAGPEAGRKLRDGIRSTLERIIAVAKAERVHAVFCGGDLYEHDYLTPDGEAFLRSAFAELGDIPVFLAPGNHDWYGPGSCYARMEWSPNVHVFDHAELTPLAFADGVTLWGAAHRAPAATDGFLRGFRTDGEGVHLALFHGSENAWFTFQEEGKVPHAPFDASEIEAAGLDFAFLGHFHRPRLTATHVYPGNPHPLTFGEDGDRGAVLAGVEDDGTVTCEPIDVATTKAHDLTCDVTGARDRTEIIKRVKHLVDRKRGMARITFAGELAPHVEFGFIDLEQVREELVRGGLFAVKFETTDLRPGYDIDRIRREQTVRGQFVREVLEDPGLGEEDRHKILTIGLRALDGRDDLEVV